MRIVSSHTSLRIRISYEFCIFWTFPELNRRRSEKCLYIVTTEEKLYKYLQAKCLFTLSQCNFSHEPTCNTLWLIDRHTDDDELRIQLDVFEDERLKDEDDYITADGIDINSHVDVFHALMKQVSNFFNRLQLPATN